MTSDSGIMSENFDNETCSVNAEMNGDSPMNEDTEINIEDDNNRESSSISDTNIPSLVAAFLSAGTTGGITYAFGLYASAIKHNLHLSQSQLDTVSAVGFFAGLLSWAPGLIVDRYGSRFGMLLGGITGAVVLMLYFVVSSGILLSISAPSSMEQEATVSVVILSVLGVAMCLCTAMITGSVFKVVVSSTGPGTRGMAVGAAKGYVGLGAGAYACIFEAAMHRAGSGAHHSHRLYSHFIASMASQTNAAVVGRKMLHDDPYPIHKNDFADDDGDMSDLYFLIMAAIFSVIIVALPALLLIPKLDATAPSQQQHRRDATTSFHFRVIYAGLLFLGIVVVWSSISELYHHSSTADDSNDGGSTLSAQSLFKAFGIFLIWVLPIISLLYVPTEKNRIRPATPIGSHIQPLISHTKRDANSGETMEMYIEMDDTNSIDLEPKGYLSQQSQTISETKENFTKSDEETPDCQERSNLIIHSEEEATMSTTLTTSTITVDEPSDNDNDDSWTPPELNLTGMLQTIPAWLMLWTCTILIGAGTAITNNMGQMVESLDLDEQTAPASLALFSAAQAASRVLTGATSEWASSSESSCRITRPMFFVVASLIASISHGILALATTETFFVLGVVSSGVAFGMVPPLMVLTVGDCFGTTHVGANYMFFDGATIAIGTITLSKFLVQAVYESHIQKDDDESLTCFGKGCFQNSHVIVSVLALTSVLTSLFMVHQTWHLYKRS